MKAVLFFLISSLFFYPSISAQDVNMLLKEAQRIEDLPDEAGALSKFKEVLKIQPINVYALSKCSELCSRIGQRQTNTKIRDEYYNSAKIYAETGLKIKPGDSDANCSMAIVLGRTSMTKSGKEKIIAAREIKKYVDASLKSNPNNFKAWHVLGRWNYEISNLNMIERAAVKMFYGGLPSASIEDAISSFEKAQTLSDGGFILNYLELAKAYHRNDEDKKAIDLLKSMQSLPIHTQDDAAIKEQAKALINKWE